MPEVSSRVAAWAEWLLRHRCRPSGVPAPIHSTDFDACEGSKGYHAIVYETSSHT